MAKSVLLALQRKTNDYLIDGKIDLGQNNDV